MVKNLRCVCDRVVLEDRRGKVSTWTTLVSPEYCIGPYIVSHRLSPSHVLRDYDGYVQKRTTDYSNDVETERVVH